MPTAPLAPLTAAAQRRVNASAERLLARAVDLLAAEMPVTPETIRSAGIPVSSGRTMIDAQKFRVNWYGLCRKQLGRIARLVVERNWFAKPVHALNKALYGGGFTFRQPAAVEWTARGSYPFRRIHDDLLDEWLVSDAVVAFWCTDAA